MARDNWVRVVTYERTLDDPEAFEKYLESKFQSLVTTFGNTPGHRRAYWVEDPADGKMAVITHWMRREAIDEAGTALATLRKEGEDFGLRMVTENNFMIKKALIPGSNPWENEGSVRVVLYENRSDDAEALHKYLEGSSFKNVERIFGAIPGYRRGYWAEEPITGTMAVVTFWDTRDSVEEAGAALAGLRQEAADDFGINMVSANNYVLRRACELD